MAVLLSVFLYEYRYVPVLRTEQLRMYSYSGIQCLYCDVRSTYIPVGYEYLYRYMYHVHVRYEYKYE